MTSEFRLPIYSGNHRELFTALHADVVGLRGRELFYEGSHLKAVQSINQYLEEKFMHPVGNFQQAFRVIRDQYGFDKHEIASVAMEWLPVICLIMRS